MNLKVDIEQQTPVPDKAVLEWIERCLSIAAEMEELPPAEVAVTLVNNEEIHRLNRDYRGVDRPTDVLSFPQWEPDEEWIVAAGERVPLGDIVISVPKAEEQAKEYGHSFTREIGFLSVHGFLHLLGYDHGTEEEEKEMFSRQEAVLSRVDLRR
jgi:probable rRNA maturation factor